MDIITHLRKRKKKHFLILSASNVNTGLEALFLEITENEWQIIQTQTYNYSQNIKTIIQKTASSAGNSITCDEFAQLDFTLTRFMVESTQNFLAQIPKTKRHLDLIILKKFSLWQGVIQSGPQDQNWDICCGDAHIVANTFSVSVLTDFLRQGIQHNRPGGLSTSIGDVIIGKKAGHYAYFINIGLIADITIVDTQESKVILSSDIGPGTCLIDLVAQQAGCDHGFDRDGTTAKKGKVHTQILEELAATPWLQQPAPKHTESRIMSEQLMHSDLKKLSLEDSLATITAFTALCISNFYKRECSSFEKKPDALWVCGGGTNNLALLDYLRGYFNPLPVKTLEELGISTQSRDALSLGLTVQAHLNQKNIILPDGATSTLETLGYWVLPQEG